MIQSRCLGLLIRQLTACQSGWNVAKILFLCVITSLGCVSLVNYWVKTLAELGSCCWYKIPRFDLSLVLVQEQETAPAATNGKKREISTVECILAMVRCDIGKLTPENNWLNDKLVKFYSTLAQPGTVLLRFWSSPVKIYEFNGPD